MEIQGNKAPKILPNNNDVKLKAKNKFSDPNITNLINEMQFAMKSGRPITSKDIKTLNSKKNAFENAINTESKKLNSFSFRIRSVFDHKIKNERNVLEKRKTEFRIFNQTLNKLLEANTGKTHLPKKNSIKRNFLQTNKETVVSNKKFFKANYNYGPPAQQIHKSNKILRVINDLTVRVIKPLIYPGASYLKAELDQERIEKAKDQLQIVGGQPITLQTPGGNKLDGMYLNTKDFKASIEKYCDLNEQENQDGTINQTLTIKPEYCTQEQVTSKINKNVTWTYLKPNKEADAFLKTLTGLGFENTPKGHISNKDPSIKENVIQLGNIPKDIPTIDERVGGSNSRPTVLISPGSFMSYAAYKGLAASYLIRGMNVMMIDFRGYGESEGSPTESRTKFDLETAYQYLQTEHHVNNQDLLIHGHCLGGGPASDLASRRSGTNLILDRTFSDYSEVAKERFPIIRHLVHRIMPSIVNYNNSENLHNVQGNVAIVIAKEDAVIPEEQIHKLIQNLPNPQVGDTQIYALIESKGQHTGLWTDEEKAAYQFDTFLHETHLRRKVF